MLHQYGLINELNLHTYVSPSTGIDTSSIDDLWRILNCSRRSFVVSPALSDPYALFNFKFELYFVQQLTHTK